MKVKEKHIHFVDLVLVLSSRSCLQTEDVGEHLPLILVGDSLTERLSVVLIQLRIQEKLV